MKHIIHFESITKVRRVCILISVFCCIWITNPAWCGLRLLLFLYSEMRLGSLGTVQSFLSRGNESQFSVWRKASVLGTVQTFLSRGN